MMNPPVSLSLVPYEDALHRLLAALSPVAPQELPLSQVEGLIAAGTQTDTPIPAESLARLDGYAVAALDLVGASALSPVPLAAQSLVIASGAVLPAGADALLPFTMVERRGPLAFALGEVLPGEGILRRGEWLASGAFIARPGLRITPAELMLAQEAGLSTLSVRRPRVAVVDMAGRAGPSARRVVAMLQSLGAEVVLGEGADELSLQAAKVDLLVTIGGTGAGPGDRTAEVIAKRGELLSHGIGFSAAPTLATGLLQGKPLIALPGAPEAAIAGVFALVLPALARLSAQSEAETISLPLKRKVSSSVGQAELLFLARETDGWHPFPPGPLSPEAWRSAAAWRMIGAGEEGWAEGTLLAAQPLHGGLPR